MASVSEFFLTSLLIELTPGPNMAYLAALSITRGRRAGLAAVSGVAMGLAILGALASVGLQAIILASPLLYQSIRAIGFFYLLWLAWETWQSPSSDDSESEAFDNFQKGLLTNILNPKAGVFYISILPAFVDPSGTSVAIQSFTLVLLYVTVATVIHTLIVVFASAAGKSLSSPKQIIVVRKSLAVGLAAVALWFLFKT